MLRRPPKSPRTATLFPSPTLFRSRTKAEAERYRSALLVAQQSGEAFDDLTGESVSWQPLADEARAHEWARRWLAEQWPEWAPRTRTSARSEEHTSELQSLMRISYAVFCLKKKTTPKT